MTFKVSSIDEADPEFLALPFEVRETFIAAFRELEAADSPICSGLNWNVDELRQNQNVAPEGLYSVHVGLWRGAFYRRGPDLIFIGFGYRIPEFYVKLKRLRASLDSEETEGA